MLKRAAKIFALSLTVITIVVFVIISAFTRRPVERVLPVASGEYLYYFAYGSNMPARYLSNVRLVDIYESMPGRLANHAIQFSPSGLPFLEPAFAILVPAKGQNAFGVLHLIDADSLFKIVCSESESYAMLEREVQRLDSGGTVQAWTLVGTASSDIGMPSRRYLNLLIEGAAAHRLPLEYRNWLARQNGVYVPLISELAATVIYATVMFHAAKSADGCSQFQSNR